MAEPIKPVAPVTNTFINSPSYQAALKLNR
jgi:hypothetical protein